MSDSVFDPEYQAGHLDAKIIVALERVAEVFRVALWEAGKVNRLSPLQIQLLIFLNFHAADKCKVSYLAREFSLSKPTISEAVRTLLKKELIHKEADAADSRSYSIHLTRAGQELVSELAPFANGLQQGVDSWSEERKARFYTDLLQLIGRLQLSGFISVQRMCQNCRFFEKEGDGFYCRLLRLPLAAEDLRIDCPEFEER